MPLLTTHIPESAVLLRFPSRPIAARAVSRNVLSPLHRPFSTTLPRPRSTAKRRSFYAWVQRVGRNFLKPAKSGTNYVTCYDDSGQLMREKDAKDRKSRTKREASKDTKAKSKEEEGEQEEAQEAEAAKEQDSIYEEDPEFRGQDEDEEPSIRSGARRTKKSEGKDDGMELRNEDLQPFPQNPVFRSESVLSPEMRDEIYARVMARGKTVRQVSQEMQVEMRRVAAVVRMKTMEQNWIKDVSLLFLRLYAYTPLGVPCPRKAAPNHTSKNT